VNAALHAHTALADAGGGEGGTSESAVSPLSVSHRSRFTTTIGFPPYLPRVHSFTPRVHSATLTPPPRPLLQLAPSPRPLLHAAASLGGRGAVGGWESVVGGGRRRVWGFGGVEGGGRAVGCCMLKELLCLLMPESVAGTVTISELTDIDYHINTIF
jgi:hypothetical protein